ncbi:cell fate (sporulation/competence/biofilm development) regulator YlbF (YheA/YmcA/DUF963 family) [Aneurinibacillus soli]|uniref:Uncharacterized protein n=1 Tax=Aneurinibacillus soli TaxID=1500254 RepID=A0A0U5BGP7_9BACL|nr:YlbF family regulator [Aneurinibacillus soli]PYE63709.1 cell fate (sporulation/competence/biofilm development) regulator YlbF (YheA/YmcA/DUF963 family) [Aneurinibacillus soli]BAU27358.1 hypothetical protein CB4_01532 [Aneurinibacillus soli]
MASKSIKVLDWNDVLERAYGIGEQLTHSQEMRRYKEMRQEMETDREAAVLIESFNRLKEAHEEVERFGTYHPDYHTVTRRVREKKRELDKVPSIAAFKQAENDLDELLYRVSRVIADAVSEQIKVPSNNPLYELAGGGCGSGGCGTGGGCGCSAR